MSARARPGGRARTRASAPQSRPPAPSAIIRAMFVVQSLPAAIVFCVITMLGWGSWANTQKLAGKEKWPFELFYWDYAIGVFLFSLVFAHTFGSFGDAGMSARANMHSIDFGFAIPALIRFVVQSLPAAIVFCVITMLGWGSWAN